ncbi:GrpB family protein [Nocardiopsis ganjiahuensis]|uniref:GrpB family protein n=1 Tax=Nocardiopsis ganjiahuensis TaxID=239984 RepID=UPI0004780B5B|nr:GrpB family protein [Nocardiopsis ganjiahuensis]
MSPLETPSLPSRGDKRVGPDPQSRNLVNGRVLISEPDPKWPYLFRQEDARIRGALGDRVLALEHVGSTAVPGLAAKPCVDLLLVVADSADEPAYLPALEAAGYTLVISEPDWFEHRVLKGPNINLNLHVFTEGCSEIDRMRLFRDYLTANTEARERYTAVKRELSERTWERIQDYADAKTGIVTALLAEAEVWHKGTAEES